MSPTATALSPTPFTTPRNISILNSHYSQYGQSVLTPMYSRSNSNISTGTKRIDSTLGSTGAAPPLPTPTTEDADKDTGNGGSAYNKDGGALGENKRPRFNYRSLLLDNSVVSKFLKKTLTDSDNFSPFSSRPTVPLATVTQLPIEVMAEIMNYVADHKTLVACLYTNKFFYKSVKAVIYSNPKLTSTYRVAQLVTSLKENPANGELVKILNLSQLTSGLILNEEYIEQHQDVFGDMDSIHSNIIGNDEMYLDYAFASWRDWKYRGDPLYGSSLLNSYNLSKTKSAVSINSLSTVSTVKLSFLQKLNLHDDLTVKFNKFRSKLLVFKKGSSMRKFKSEIKQQSATRHQPPIASKPPASKSKSVHFSNSSRNAKNQPFVEHHPYTNKFLLRYASTKDIPIGYILHLIELCPNLAHVDLSTISLSSDSRIEYHDELKPHHQFSSLIEDVLPPKKRTNSGTGITPFASSGTQFGNPPMEETDLKPKYLSDSNMSTKSGYSTTQHELVRLQDFEILESLAQLQYLQSLKLSSISWLNYTKLRDFYLTAKSISNRNDSLKSSLQKVDLTNSGMRRGLNWAHEFVEIDEFKRYFSNDQEPSTQEEPADTVTRIGLNY